MDQLLAEDAFAEYHFFLQSDKNRLFLRESLAGKFPELIAQKRIKLFLRKDLYNALTCNTYYCFHLSDCINYPAYLADLRNKVSNSLFPITGVTHSLSLSSYAKDFLAYLWPGCTPRDCIVATSRAGQEAVRHYFDYLRSSLGLKGLDPEIPRVRRIPLGVDSNKFFPAGDELKILSREKLQIEASKIVILVFGRISHQSKMDLIPLLRALQRVAAQEIDLDNVCLCLAGWVDEQDNTQKKIQALASNIALEVRFFAKPDEDLKQTIFKSADLFVSIADNPQETFGLTVLEAAASGLPVLVSDYDGYKDLVVPGETGYMVPTIGPKQSNFVNMLAPLVHDGLYHQYIAQQTVVQVPKLAEYLKRLLTDKGLREEMGQKARKQVMQNYTWSQVLQSYFQLWEALWSEEVPWPDRQANHPLQIPYARIFSHYVSQVLDVQDTVYWTRSGEALYRNQEFPILYFAMEARINTQMLPKIVFLARHPILVQDLLEKGLQAGFCSDRDQAEYVLLWLIKHDFLEYRIE